MEGYRNETDESSRAKTVANGRKFKTVPKHDAALRVGNLLEEKAKIQRMKSNLQLEREQLLTEKKLLHKKSEELDVRTREVEHLKSLILLDRRCDRTAFFDFFKSEGPACSLCAERKALTLKDEEALQHERALFAEDVKELKRVRADVLNQLDEMRRESEHFRAEKDEMAIMRKAYLAEKTSIRQNMAPAEKETMLRHLVSKTAKNCFIVKQISMTPSENDPGEESDEIRSKATGMEGNAKANHVGKLETEKQEVEEMKEILQKEKMHMQRVRRSFKMELSLLQQKRRCMAERMEWMMAESEWFDIELQDRERRFRACLREKERLREIWAALERGRKSLQKPSKRPASGLFCLYRSDRRDCATSHTDNWNGEKEAADDKRRDTRTFVKLCKKFWPKKKRRSSGTALDDLQRAEAELELFRASLEEEKAKMEEEEMLVDDKIKALLVRKNSEDQQVRREVAGLQVLTEASVETSRKSQDGNVTSGSVV